MGVNETKLYKKRVHAFLNSKFPDGYSLSWLNDKQFSLQTMYRFLIKKQTRKSVQLVLLTLLVKWSLVMLKRFYLYLQQIAKSRRHTQQATIRGKHTKIIPAIKGIKGYAND